MSPRSGPHVFETITRRLGSLPGASPGAIANTPVRPRRLLYLAVFFTFSSLGFIVDILQPTIEAPFRVLLTAAATGLVAMGFVYIAAYHARWFPLALIGMLAMTFGNAFLLNQSPGMLLSKAPPDAVRVKLLIDGLGCLFGFVASYTFFMAFIGMETQRHARVLAEMEIAGEIHRLLVPTIVRTEGRFEFYGTAVPSTEVGGDLVDVLPTAGGWLGYVADISGHGVGAGLLMGIVKSAVRTRLLAGGTLDEILADVNRVLLPLRKPNMFATFAAVLHDEQCGTSFVTAGHPPILHFRAASGVVEELSIPQLPLAMFDDHPFRCEPIAPAPGDLLMIVTDGLTEVFDAADREFGMAGVAATLRANASLPLSEIAEELLRRTRAHGAKSDDQTLLLIRVA
jgi:hypothetical protein